MYIYGVHVGHKNIFFKDTCAHEMLICAENLLWLALSLHLLPVIYSGSREESKYCFHVSKTVTLWISLLVIHHFLTADDVGLCCIAVL